MKSPDDGVEWAFIGSRRTPCDGAKGPALHPHSEPIKCFITAWETGFFKMFFDLKPNDSDEAIARAYIGSIKPGLDRTFPGKYFNQITFEEIESMKGQPVPAVGRAGTVGYVANF